MALHWYATFELKFKYLLASATGFILGILFSKRSLCFHLNILLCYSKNTTSTHTFCLLKYLCSLSPSTATVLYFMDTEWLLYYNRPQPKYSIHHTNSSIYTWFYHFISNIFSINSVIVQKVLTLFHETKIKRLHRILVSW